MEGWAALEPERWARLRRATSLCGWGLVVSLLGCGAFLGGPLTVVGARVAMRWAPTVRAQRSAEVLLGSAIVSWLLLVVGFVGALAGLDELEAGGLLVGAGLAGLVESVAVVSLYVALADWTGSASLVERWHRALRRTPYVIVVAVVALIASLVVPAAMVVVALASIALTWTLGYPIWSTCRVYRAELLPASSTDPLWRSAW
jgi:hypothetical protein